MYFFFDFGTELAAALYLFSDFLVTYTTGVGLLDLSLYFRLDFGGERLRDFTGDGDLSSLYDFLPDLCWAGGGDGVRDRLRDLLREIDLSCLLCSLLVS